MSKEPPLRRLITINYLIQNRGMSAKLYPLKFIPQFKSVIWGGSRLAAFKATEAATNDVGESWELSDVTSHESIVADGELQGCSLHDLITNYGEKLVGEIPLRRFGTKFPILIKLIDANDDLSVQVHPDDTLAAARHNCMGKTEMWYVIDVQPGAKIYSGMARHITPDQYVDHVADGTFTDDIACHKSHPGDVFFIPAGRVHAIGAGNLIAEIQQTSDITYRIYDYNRRDAQGNLRQLHTEEARDAIDYNVSDDYLSTYDHNAPVATLVDCPFFTVKLLKPQGTLAVDMPQGSFLSLTAVAGEANIIADGVTVSIRQGETVLVPAETSSLTLDGTATILSASIPSEK